MPQPEVVVGFGGAFGLALGLSSGVFFTVLFLVSRFCDRRTATAKPVQEVPSAAASQGDDNQASRRDKAGHRVKRGVRITTRKPSARSYGRMAEGDDREVEMREADGHANDIAMEQEKHDIL